MPRITLRDVAQASGVSPATASFVLNDNPAQTISPATQERVRNAAAELGYVPHGIAKALAEGSSRIVVLNVEQRLAGHYVRSYIQGLDDELRQHGYVLLVRHGLPAAQSDQRVLDAITPRAVLALGASYRHGNELDDSGGGWRDGLAAHSATQIRYLAAQGHERIGLLLPAAEAPLAALRLRFSNETAAALGLSPVMPVTIPPTRGEAASTIAALRQQQPQLTALAALDDDLAIEVLAAMHDLGLSAPADLAVIGYDDTGYGEFSTPTLTTLHIDAEAHGRISAREALALDTAGLVLTPASVLVRESA